MSERRRHLRVLVPGAFCELLVDGVTIGVVPIEDVSDSGVFVAFPRPVVPVRTPVSLRFIEEATPLVIDGVIAQVVPPGGPRSPGYGVELKDPPHDTVERVVAQRAPTPPRGSPLPRTSTSTVNVAPSPPPPSSATTTIDETGPAVLILGLTKGDGAAMAQALSLFGATSQFFAEARAFVEAVDRRVRVALVELAVLEAGGASIAQIRTASPKARIVVAADKLPDVDVRAKLLRQGADEILLLPYDVFVVMAKVHASVTRRDARR